MSPQPDSFRFDIEKLLSPISAERPSGAFLVYEGLYDQIKEARREDDSGLAQGVWKTDLKKADWRAVERLCLDALETRTKDLQIAAWLMEAWIYLHGFAGAAQGMRLVAALADSFWTDIHPQAVDGDLEFRMAPFYWINEKLDIVLKVVPFTRPETDDLSAFSSSDLENSMRLETAESKAAQAAGDPRRKTSYARVQESIMLTPSPHFERVLREIGELVDACAAVQRLIDEKAGRAAASLVQFRSTAEAVGHVVENILRQRGPRDVVPAEPEHEEAFGENGWDSAETPQVRPSQRIRTRAEAYQLLAEAADFLMRTEPHSPAPYLVRRAIGWGGMRLEELLPELVRNQSELTEIFRLLQLGGPGSGIK